MTARSVLPFLLFLAGLAAAIPADAQGVRGAAQKMVRDYQRNDCWPAPFLKAERFSVRAPFAIMIHNGWRQQNLLADHHFEEGSAELSEAGKAKVYGIATFAPRHHRGIYVGRTDSMTTTTERIANVQQYAAQVAGPGPLPTVQETTVAFESWSAGQIDHVSRSWYASMPNPRLSGSGGSNDSGK